MYVAYVYKQGTCVVYPFTIYEIYGVGVA